jgi:hypothetical protein
MRLKAKLNLSVNALWPKAQSLSKELVKNRHNATLNQIRPNT